MSHNPKVLIVGDVMIDEWVYGEVNRLSPEAPIPIVDIDRRNRMLGGAGNVYRNVQALGGDPYLISGVCEKTDGEWIKQMVNGDFYHIPKTFVKTRICSGQQQIVRLDTGLGRDIDDIECERILDLYDDFDIVVVSDYGKGAVTETMLNDISDFCFDKQIKLLVDPYMRDYYFSNALEGELIKLNKMEAEFFTGMKIENELCIPEMGRILLSTFKGMKSVLVTLGVDGMVYFDRNEHHYDNYLRIRHNDPVKVYDVSGAGDVVISVLAYLMSFTKGKIVGGEPLYKMQGMLKIASKAGRIAVSKKETSVVTHNELFNGDI